MGRSSRGEMVFGREDEVRGDRAGETTEEHAVCFAGVEADFGQAPGPGGSGGEDVGFVE